MPTAGNFFDEREKQLLVNAIAEAEKKTSGEIRLHIENFCFGNELNAAAKIFKRLKMSETKERNGILIYIAVVSRKVAVYGDEGIHTRLEKDFWQKIVDKLVTQFRANNKAEALAQCIVECGEQLGKFFPRKDGDADELSNKISF
jgi:uncharacterized membrane protein